MENEKKPMSKKKLILIIVCAVLALLMALLVGGVIWVNSALNQMGDLTEGTIDPSLLESILSATDDVDATVAVDLPTVDPSDVTIPTVPVDTIPISDQVINILLVGQDRRGGTYNSHSDSTILCTIDRVNKKLTMTSFMRDMYVQIPDYYPWKINVAYMIGGASLLNDTLEYNFGVRADHTVAVDFSGFQKIIDLVGGLDIELTQKEANYLNRRGLWDVDESSAGTWSLTEGVNHMDGAQTLAYSRIRAIGDDFERTNRQRKVLTLLVEKTKTLNIMEIYDLVNEFLPLVATDMDNIEIMSYAVTLLPILKDLEIVTQRIPADGTYTYQSIAGPGSCIVPNMEKNRQILIDTIGAAAE
ncbi:MAG: LCP family protein [Oscillospiraceae bacterium]|nr:LCP family protein [Oscillospiraceae bacterium]